MTQGTFKEREQKPRGTVDWSFTVPEVDRETWSEKEGIAYNVKF